MDPYFEISVMRNGRLMFATDSRSVTNAEYATDVIELFREKFPKEQGYRVSCVVRDGHGKDSGL